MLVEVTAGRVLWSTDAVVGTAVEPEHPRAAGRRPAEIAALTGLRGFAALAVLLVHTAGRSSYPWVGIHGYGPVALFTLSGFLLFAPWGRWILGRSDRPRLRRFFKRRIVRVFPAYLVVMVAMLVMYPASQPNGVDGWLRAFTLTGTFASDGLRPGLEQTWSMGTELTWYVALPVMGLLVGLLVSRRSPRAALWWSLGLLVLAVPITVGYRIFVQAHHLGPQFTWSFWLPAFLVCFAGGAAVALILEGERAGVLELRRLRRLVGSPIVGFGLAAILIAIGGSPLGGPTEYAPASFGERSIRFACSAALALLLLAGVAVAGPGALISRLLSARWIVAIGRWSYGIYLWHLPVIVLLADDFTHRAGVDGFFLWVAVVSAVSVALGAATYAWIERPTLAWSGRT